MSKKALIGIDLGGTNIKVGLVDPSGQLIGVNEGPTHVEEGAHSVLSRMAQMAKQIAKDHYIDWADISGVGVGIPGFIDMKKGIVVLAPNLHWKNTLVKEPLFELLQKPVVIGNDANVAALGEAWSGAGIGVSHLVCITLGTGIGGGIIIDGHIYQGYQGMAGEIGHIPIITGEEAEICGCGRLGCLETVSSATGIVRIAKKRLAEGAASSLSLLPEVTAKDVFTAAQAGDAFALSVVHHVTDVLGRVIAGLAVTLNPGRFVIGGGVSRAGELLLTPIREAFAKYAPYTVVENTDIVAATLGNRAGVVGAAGMVAK